MSATAEADVSGDKIVLIDGPALAYRSFYAFIRNPLATSSGEQTSVPFGFARALAKIAAEEKPDYWAVVFDAAAPTFRHEEFPDYKANRPPMPDDMRPQLGRVDELLAALRVPRLMMEGYEADDILATLAVKAATQGLDVVLVSGDKDLCQIVDDRIRVRSFGKADQPGGLLDSEAVEKKFGVPPEKMADMLALMGDSSDNVPGVAGVGPKTAVRLLREFGDLEALYDRVDEVEPEGLRKKLIAGKDRAFLSKGLVTLELNVPVGAGLENLKRMRPDREEAARLLKELEFGGMIKLLLPSEDGASSRPLGEGTEAGGDVPAGAGGDDSRDDRGGGPSRGTGSLADYLAEALEREGGMEAAGEGARLRKGEGAAWSFALSRDPNGRVGAAVCDASGPPIYGEPAGEEERSLIGRFLESDEHPKAVHDLKNEAHAAAGAGWRIRGVECDVMLASYLLNPDENHDLEGLIAGRLGEGPAPVLEPTPESATRRKAKAVRDLDRILSAEISAAGMEGLLRDIEIPLALVLREMEAAGVALDLDALADFSGRLEKMIKLSEEDIFCMAGVKFNINSPQQLSEVLFRHLRLKPGRRTKTGYSTDSSALEDLAVEHELPREVLNYRRLVKLKSTYADALPRLVNAGTGRVHATFHQAVTATGRLSSSDPNLQNIPIRTELGREIRKAFIPGTPGWVLVAADYSQIELRIMAHLSGDEALTESFLKDEDVHAATASAVFGVPLEKVDEELRSRAKMVNYGVMYGMGPSGLARRLGIKRAAASDFIEEYFAKMPGVGSFLEELIEVARERGYATTIMNRRRSLPAILSSDRRAKAYAERIAVNTPIQGSAADIIKKAMVRISDRMAELRMASKMILQVHDELVFEGPPDETASLRGLVKEIMESAVKLSVPLSVRVETGGNWAEIHR
jgi:DNA polymerase-1